MLFFWPPGRWIGRRLRREGGCPAPMVPKEYWNKVKTEADIESYYLGYGNYQISHTNEKAEKPVNKYVIYYPEELNQDKYPIVVIVNGTGVFANKAKPLFEHLASWGFIVIGNYDGSTWSGQSGQSHGEMLYSADGYVTAWFMWHLQNDTNAAKAFVGSNAEILNNPIYQNQNCQIVETYQ